MWRLVATPLELDRERQRFINGLTKRLAFARFQLAALQASPPAVDVQILELHVQAADTALAPHVPDFPVDCDIFLRVKLTLRETQPTGALEYELSSVLHDNAIRADSVDDIQDWGLVTEKKPVGIGTTFHYTVANLESIFLGRFFTMDSGNRTSVKLCARRTGLISTEDSLVALWAVLLCGRGLWHNRQYISAFARRRSILSCRRHSPEQKQDPRATRRNRRYPLRSETEPIRLPQTAKEVKDLLAEAMAGVHAGRLEPRMGSVMAYLGTALLKAIETTDYQERIEALEESDKKD